MGNPVDGARVLDLFAGTGALGLEALSRGAAFCMFIEEAAEARGLIRTNVEAFGLTGRTKIFRRDATKLGPAGTVQPFDLVFADPPYGKGLGEQALHSAAEGGWLAPQALCVVEEARRCDLRTRRRIQPSRPSATMARRWSASCRRHDPDGAARPDDEQFTFRRAMAAHIERLSRQRGATA